MNKAAAAISLIAAAVLVPSTIAGRAAAAAATPATIYIENASTNVTDASLADALPAFQAAIDSDFAPYWNTGATLALLPTGQAVPDGAWTISLDDYSDLSGAAGYHSIDLYDTPYAKVFTHSGINWQLVFTHELFEMLADPHVDRATFIWPRAVFYVLEVCDPVERQRWSYMRASATGQRVVISDFVTERWYDGIGGQRLDFMGYVHHALHLLDGGYATVFANGVWQNQARADGRPAAVFYRHR